MLLRDGEKYFPRLQHRWEYPIGQGYSLNGQEAHCGKELPVGTSAGCVRKDSNGRACKAFPRHRRDVPGILDMLGKCAGHPRHSGKMCWASLAHLMDVLGTPGTFDGCATGILPVMWEVPFLLW